jgi:hypothetical protein
LLERLSYLPQPRCARSPSCHGFARFRVIERAQITELAAQGLLTDDGDRVYPSAELRDNLSKRIAAIAIPSLKEPHPAPICRHRRVGGQSSGLMAGVRAPDIEVTFDKRDQPFPFPEPDRRARLAFVSSECESCAKLLIAVERQVDFDGPVYGLVAGERSAQFPPAGLQQIQLLWLAHPPDVVRSFGASTVPMVYVLRGRTVLASKVVATAAGVERLLAQADAYEASTTEPNGRASHAEIAGR